MSAEPHVELEGVRMAFGERVVFEDLSCAFPRGAISVILGGSGGGKSTLLRIVGGLVHPERGRVVVDGEDVTRLPERQLYRVRRKLGMLFQGGALLDSLTVFDNLALPLREHSELGEAAIADEVHDRLEAVGLRDVDDLLPNQLSGGMTKRVGLARAIIEKPDILLCDEPFSGLDPISAKRIEALLVEMHQRYRVTMLLVSHDVPSTMRMAANIVLLLPWGPVTGTPDMLRASNDPHVQAFLSEDVAQSLALEQD
jgi:phospholipid/cholesterol/gamma-HCH transport system ATP-binding protein